MSWCHTIKFELIVGKYSETRSENTYTGCLANDNDPEKIKNATQNIFL